MTTPVRTHRRYRITGELEVISPLHIGTGTERPGVDDAVQTDGAGHLIVPGTALAGVLRVALQERVEQHLIDTWKPSAPVEEPPPAVEEQAAKKSKKEKRAAKKAKVARPDKQPVSASLSEEEISSIRAKATATIDRYFGTKPTKGGSDSDTVASRLIIDDSPAIFPQSPAVAVWHGNGISRRSGAAEPGVLYAQEIIEPGTRFRLSIEVDDPSDAADPTASEVQSLASTVAAVLKSGISLGRSTSTGLGYLRLDDAELTHSGDLGTRAGMLESLGGRAEAKLAIPQLARAGVAPASVQFTVCWAPTGTIMCGVATEGAVTQLPRVVSRHQKTDRGAQPTAEVALVIPGSSIKGSLRQHAELVSRTVASGQDLVRSGSTLLKDTQDERLPAVLMLFGRPARKGTRNGEPVQLGHKGRLVVSSCTTRQRVSAAAWQKLIDAIPKPGAAEKINERARRDDSRTPESLARENTRQAVAQLNRSVAEAQGQRLLTFEVVDRNAIDRWTNGAADGLLFATLEATQSDWTPLQLTLDLQDVDPQIRDDMIGLLFVLVRELSDGWITFGPGRGRGWGGVKILEVKCQVGKALPEFAALEGAVPIPGSSEPIAGQQNKERLAVMDRLIAGWFERQAGVRHG